ncbi:Pyrimidine-specific ribonucleoside hydrolase RihA [Paenibacillus sp. CECT 9249]|uniref:nucleoside hydrolase n=1 Tax=Paenibacillus sp. CECT 9249 TaxID=2845385 RepID=UPI001E5DC616|nr:nucleoside hydrolase [Paenibacillus sp. CECT 9249]CAH0120233.1 Pyrimidine-specific ribonucleoside hydrolase RihA [Paenibacillus sp. CECT 9249]
MEKVILDVDPGHDDAIAILMAAKAPELELLGITTVAGNQTLEKTTENARKVVALTGRSIEIARGHARPMMRDPIIAEMIHGETGLDGVDLPESDAAITSFNAVDWLKKAIDEADGPVTLIPVGPLTNIAVLLLAYPELKSKIKRMVLMGGAIGRGNRTPSAEFNILVDPEAAKIVFHSGVPITMIGLDVTHQVIATPQIVESIRALRNPVSDIVALWLSFFSKSYQSFYHMEGGPLHDPCAVAAVIDPGILTTEDLYVDIETKGEITAGRTVVDLIGVTRNKPNVQVATGIDTERFWELLFRSLKAYS